MPLLKVQSANATELTEEVRLKLTNQLRQTKTSEEAPLILFPGILGDGIEFTDLRSDLELANPNRDIYIWFDSLITPDLTTAVPENDDTKRISYKENPTLQEEAELRAECIRTILSGRVPVLIGYSKGAIDVLYTANELKKLGMDAKAVIIDGVTPAHARNYFSKPSSALTQDLIDMVKLAAIYAARDHEDELSIREKIAKHQLPPHLKQALKSKTPLENLDEITKSIISFVSELKSLEKFEKYIRLAKRGVSNLKDAPDLKFEFANEVIALITNVTGIKYDDVLGGWVEYANKLFLMDDTDLTYLSHSQVILAQKNQDKPGKLAVAIEKFAKNIPTNQITKQTVVSGMLDLRDTLMPKIDINTSNEQKQEMLGSLIAELLEFQLRLRDESSISNLPPESNTAPIIEDETTIRARSRSPDSPKNVRSYSDNDDSSDDVKDESKLPMKDFGRVFGNVLVNTFFAPSINKRNNLEKPCPVIKVGGPSPT